MQFLRALGADVNTVDGDWADWAPHHVGFPTVAEGFDSEFDSSAFGAYWGGLPTCFNGVVVNLLAEDRAGVDAAFELALSLGADGLKAPYDAFWGSRFAVVRGPGPIMVGLTSDMDAAFRTAGPAVSDFA